MSLQRNALLLILLTGLLGILAQWTAVFGRLWSLPGALVLLGLIYESLWVRRESVGLRLLGPERWPLGRERTIQFLFVQDRRAQLRIQAALQAPAQFAAETRIAPLRLARGQTVALELRAEPRRLGRYRWPVPALRVAGPLQLAWWPAHPAAEYIATVIPDLIGRSERIGGNASGEGTATHFGGGSTEILQLREYRHGDSLHAIDWKASARRGRLVSRELAEERRLEIVLAVDVGRTSALATGPIDRLGLYVNVAARLAQRAVELDDAVGLLLFAERPLTLLAPTRGAAAVTRIRRLLTECTVHAGQANPALAAARIRAAAPRRLLVVLLTDVLDTAIEELSEAVRLLGTKHFTLICGLENPAIAALPSAVPADALAPYRALAADEYHRTLTGNVRALRAMGAAALIERPEQLDRAVLDAYQRFRRERRI